jgi:hypothetical protein
MFGNVQANTTFASITGTTATVTSTSLTGTGFPTTGGPNTGLQGQVVVATSAGTAVWGVILSNTSTVLTIDQWYNPKSASGASGTTPSGTVTYLILPNAGTAIWMGLSSDDTTIPNPNTDVLSSSTGLFTSGGSSGPASEYVGNGLDRQFIQPTFPAAGQVTLTATYNYTGSALITLYKALLCNSKPSSGSLLVLETLLSAPGSVAQTGDSIQNIWTINL